MQMDPEIGSVHQLHLYFDWSWMACGFGQLSVDIFEDHGEIVVRDELMGRERVRKLLIKLANDICDNARFESEHPPFLEEPEK